MIDQVKKQFEKDTANHKMEILKDDGLYRHLRFTNNGSQVYRFDIHTWPGYLCVCGDMGTFVFSRVPDMFDFFKMDDNDFNKKHVINPHYWAEKLQATSTSRSMDSNGYEEFSSDVFAEHIKTEYDKFCEEYLDDGSEGVTEAYAEEKQTREHQLEQLWECLEDAVLPASYDGPVRAYDAAMDFRWESDDGELTFDMQDFWEHNCTEYTHHYIWILYAIVWGIGVYDEALTMSNDISSKDVELHQE
jgi:hypothetical protein